MKIDEILNNVKVEWKQLGEIADITGAGVDKKIIKNEQSVVLLNYLDVYNNIYLDRSIPKMVVTASEYKIKTCNVEYGDIFITPSSETVEDIFRSAVAKENMQGVVYSYHIMRIRLKEPNFITACYLNYLFTAEIFRKSMFRLVNGNTRKTITKSNIENLQIPVPPLVIQEKIVKILDKFTNYATELQTELQLRTKQYEYYRNLLLSKEFLENMCVKFDDKPCGGGATRNKDVR